MRINLFAGPSSGKSTVSSFIYSNLKSRGYNIELVREYIKNWAYLNRSPKSFDQIYIFGKQLHAEDFLLQSGVEHIVTDSPIYMQIAYMKRNQDVFWPNLIGICNEFEHRHPSINIILDRTGLDYANEGRFEDLEGAREMDRIIESVVQEYALRNYVKLKTIDQKAILDYVLDTLD